jgi:hypothetical protein
MLEIMLSELQKGSLIILKAEIKGPQQMFKRETREGRW